jgi:hypothetical protein
MTGFQLGLLRYGISAKGTHARRETRPDFVAKLGLELYAQHHIGKLGGGLIIHVQLSGTKPANRDMRNKQSGQAQPEPDVNVTDPKP